LIIMKLRNIAMDYKKSAQFLTILLFVLAFNVLKAQSTNDVLAELNRDIWKPFVDGVNTNNPELYNGVNSAEFYWVLDGTKPRIMNLVEYIEDAHRVMKSRTEKGIGTTLEIRFIQRNVTTDFASEKCIIKYISTAPGKEPEIFYGFVHVFSRKEKGVWRKLIQHASTESATQEQFDKALRLNNSVRVLEFVRVARGT